MCSRIFLAGFVTWSLAQSLPAYAAVKNVITELSWVTQNDTVMGGVSRAQLAWNAADELVWTGNLSLDNNGGFVSIFARDRWFDWTAYDGLEVVLTGGGRAIQVTAQRRDARVRAGGYRALIPTESKGDTRVVIPFSAFVLKRFGRPIRGPDLRSGLGQIGRLGLLIADKQPGPFRVILKSMRPVRVGKRSTLGAEVRQRLVSAIEVGVPAFNSGDVSACAIIYGRTIRELLEQGLLGDGTWASRLAKQALDRAAKQPSRDAAWTLRRAMDQILASM